ncbi:MAG: hypothetical protein AAF355_13120, partial [Myxococcota bacterium]
KKETSGAGPMDAGAFVRLDDGALSGRFDMSPDRSHAHGHRNYPIASDRSHYAFDAIALRSW